MMNYYDIFSQRTNGFYLNLQHKLLNVSFRKQTETNKKVHNNIFVDDIFNFFISIYFFNSTHVLSLLCIAVIPQKLQKSPYKIYIRDSVHEQFTCAHPLKTPLKMKFA